MKSDLLMLNLEEYNNIILDFDGVVIDTNKKKEENINIALSKHMSIIPYKKCLTHFNQNPGIGRRKKLEKFIYDKNILNQVLDDYKKENYKTLFDCELIPGILKFLKKIHVSHKVILLSGSDENELNDILEHKKLYGYFKFIGGASKSKLNHLDEINLNEKTLYFGDSHYDNFVANKFGFDFVFVNGYTKILSKSLDFDFIFETTNFNNL